MTVAAHIACAYLIALPFLLLGVAAWFHYADFTEADDWAATALDDQPVDVWSQDQIDAEFDRLTDALRRPASS